MKCKNCGAELKYGKCEYCGSVFDDAWYLVPEVKFTEEQFRKIIAKSPILNEADKVLEVTTLGDSEPVYIKG